MDAVTTPRVAVWRNGAATAASPDEPVVTAFDLGLGRGDGVFESALVAGGATPHLEDHLVRLRRSAGILGLAHPGDDAVRAVVAAAVEGWPADVEGACRVFLTRGMGEGTPPTLLALLAAVPAETLRQRTEGISVVTLSLGISADVRARAPWLLGGAKTLSYAVNMAALRHAKANGADDVLFVSSDGQLLEGPTSTALLVRRDAEGRRELVTPLRQQGILAGTSQAVVFAAAEREGWPLGYGPLTPADLEGIEGLWLASSVRGVAPVLSVDGEPLPVDDELTDRLNAWLREDRDPGAHAVTVD